MSPRYDVHNDHIVDTDDMINDNMQKTIHRRYPQDQIQDYIVMKENMMHNLYPS